MGISLIVPGVSFSGRNLGQVTPSAAIPVDAIAIKGPSIVLGQAQYKVIFYPTFTNQRGVSWSIVSGDAYATIDSSGVVRAKTGASADSVTIRCTSTSNPSVIAEKTISVTFGVIEYYDYLESNGDAYIVTTSPNIQWGTKITVRGTLGGNNGYLFGSKYASNSTQAYLASYTNTSGLGAAIIGTLSTSAITFAKAAGVRYRWEFICSTSSSTTNGSCTAYNDSTGQQLATRTGATMTCSGVFSIFTQGYGPSSASFVDAAALHGACKFYGLTAEYGGETLIDLRPCTIDGVPAIHNLISGAAYYNSAESGLTAGND